MYMYNVIHEIFIHDIVHVHEKNMSIGYKVELIISKYKYSVPVNYKKLTNFEH